MHIRKEEEEEEASRALFVYSPPSTSIRSMTLSRFPLPPPPPACKFLQPSVCIQYTHHLMQLASACCWKETSFPTRKVFFPENGRRRNIIIPLSLSPPKGLFLFLFRPPFAGMSGSRMEKKKKRLDPSRVARRRNGSPTPPLLLPFSPRKSESREKGKGRKRKGKALSDLRLKYGRILHIHISTVKRFFL